MGGLFDTLRGLWCLFAAAWRAGFRFRSGYWRWRIVTAYGESAGRGGGGRRSERISDVVHHARWIGRMRRGM